MHSFKQLVIVILPNFWGGKSFPKHYFTYQLSLWIHMIEINYLFPPVYRELIHQSCGNYT